jgi:hypothetical protein
MAAVTQPLTVYIPDTRGVEVSRYGKGNLKIGLGVFTYSRLPGLPTELPLGITDAQVEDGLFKQTSSFAASDRPCGTCPGATEECLRICYAARPVTEDGAVYQMWLRNGSPDVPPIPAECKILRLHVSGDFDSVEYIQNWIVRLGERPDVTAWVYTKSWRVPELLAHLEYLRALPNVQMFASMDKSKLDFPPRGWRRAWIDGDARGGHPQLVRAHMDDPVTHNLVTYDGTHSYVCPEETKRQPNCEACKYCFEGKANDVTFLEH